MNFVYKFNPEAKLPTKAHASDAAFDLYALDDIYIAQGTTQMIPTGLAIEVPEGYYAQITDRSSMAAKGLKVSGGVVDSLYTGEWKVILSNLTQSPGYQIHKGDRIAQFILLKTHNVSYVETQSLWTSERGNKGLGSSGR